MRCLIIHWNAFCKNLHKKSTRETLNVNFSNTWILRSATYSWINREVSTKTYLKLGEIRVYIT